MIVVECRVYETSGTPLCQEINAAIRRMEGRGESLMGVSIVESPLTCQHTETQTLVYYTIVKP